MLRDWLLVFTATHFTWEKRLTSHITSLIMVFTDEDCIAIIFRCQNKGFRARRLVKEFVYVGLCVCCSESDFRDFQQCYVQSVLVNCAAGNQQLSFCPVLFSYTSSFRHFPNTFSFVAAVNYKQLTMRHLLFINFLCYAFVLIITYLLLLCYCLHLFIYFAFIFTAIYVSQCCIHESFETARMR